MPAIVPTLTNNNPIGRPALRVITISSSARSVDLFKLTVFRPGHNPDAQIAALNRPAVSESSNATAPLSRAEIPARVSRTWRAQAAGV